MSHTKELWPEPTIETRIRPDGVMNVVGEIKGIAVFESHSDAVRAVADHNACAGMENPAEEIQRMRETLLEIATGGCEGASDNACHIEFDKIEYFCTPCKCAAALKSTSKP